MFFCPNILFFVIRVESISIFLFIYKSFFSYVFRLSKVSKLNSIRIIYDIRILAWMKKNFARLVVKIVERYN